MKSMALVRPLTGSAHWPFSLHGVGLSLSSVEGIDGDHLLRLARLVEQWRMAG